MPRSEAEMIGLHEPFSADCRHVMQSVNEVFDAKEKASCVALEEYGEYTQLT